MAHNVLQETYKAEHRLLDPGDAETISVLNKDLSYVPLVTGASLEARTLADPLRAGIRLTLALKTHGGGNVVVTGSSGVDFAGNTAMTFATAGGAVHFISIELGSAFEWRAIEADGVSGLAIGGTAATAFLDGVTITWGTGLDMVEQYENTGNKYTLTGLAAGGTDIILTGGTHATTGGQFSGVGGAGVTNGAGGPIVLTGGAGPGTGDGGAVNITGGAKTGGATGTGGAVVMAGGANANATN
ncbi:hypothetical protein LCGC14_2659490, partial [marine sediment metagenome]